MTAFPDRLKRLMAERNITAIDLAGRMGVSDVTVRHWMHGRWNLKIRHALKLARLFGTTCEWLFRDEQEPLQVNPAWLAASHELDPETMQIKPRQAATIPVRMTCPSCGQESQMDWPKDVPVYRCWKCGCGHSPLELEWPGNCGSEAQGGQAIVST